MWLHNNGLFESIDRNLSTILGSTFRICASFFRLSGIMVKSVMNTRTKQVTLDDTICVIEGYFMFCFCPIWYLILTVESKRRNLKMKTFENFVVIPANRLAHRAADNVCQSPGNHNPLYLFGATGTGKTHLLMAIADQFQKNGKTAQYLSCQQFCDEMICAIKAGTNAEFQKKYYEADIILMDGLQYIAGKETTQAELVAILDKRVSDHKQTVFAGSIPPSQISLWNSEISSCLTGGLCIEMQAPNYEETAQIVANKLKEHGMDWPMEACQYVALNIGSGRNQIDGEINKIVFLNTLNNEKK